MAQVVKHRRPAETGYARGDETRERIVLTALRLFGELGFAGASTRDIASAAGVNAPALQYYFDSKEGLYLACVAHIVEQAWDHVGEVVDEGERALHAGGSDAALIEAYCAIQAQMADFMFTASDANEWRLFLARQQAGMGPEAGFQILHERLSKRVSAVTSGIVGRLLGRPARDDETLIRTMALNGQLMVFQVMRRSVLTTLNWKAVDAKRLAKLKSIVREQTVTALRAMIAARDATSANR